MPTPCPKCSKKGKDCKCSFRYKYGTPIKKKPYKIRRNSVKREKQNREYSKRRKKKLEENPVCQMQFDCCTYWATEVHHPEGRIEEKLLDLDECITGCRNCHVHAETHPEEAKEKGISRDRVGEHVNKNSPEKLKEWAEKEKNPL